LFFTHILTANRIVCYLFANCLQFRATVNKVAVTTWVQIFCRLQNKIQQALQYHTEGPFQKVKSQKHATKLILQRTLTYSMRAKNKNAKHDIVEPQLGKCQPSCWDSIHNQKRYQRACLFSPSPHHIYRERPCEETQQEAVAIYSQGECSPQTLTLLAPSSYCLNGPV